MDFAALASVLIALGLGGIVGLERELARKSAGLRTNMLVAGAAAFLVHLSDLVVELFCSIRRESCASIRSAPSRRS